MTIHDDRILLFNREIELVWVQGVIVFVDIEQQEAIIDDGTDIVHLLFANARVKYDFQVGQYVLVHAHVVAGEDESGRLMFFLEAKRMEPLQDPNYESLWLLEIVQAHNQKAKH